MNVAKNSLIIFCSKVLIAVLLFLSQIILARKLGPEGMGIYNLFLAVAGISLLLGNLGVGNASIYLMNKEKKSPVQLFSNSLIFGALWGIILAGLFYLIYLVFPSLVSGLPKNYVFLAILVIPIILLYNYLLPFLLAKFQILKWSVFSILYAALILLGTVILVVVFNFGTIGAILAVVFSCIFSLFAVFVYLFKLFSLKLHFDKSLFKREIQFGISSYLGDVFNGKTINFMLSTFVINIFLGVTNVGYYSVAFSVATILFFIPYSFQQILYSVWSSSREEEIDKKTPEIGRQILILGLLSAIFFALIGKYFILLFYGKEFYSSILPFFLILPGVVFITFASVFFNNFFAKGKPYIASCILICALIINIFLNIILVPIIGINGAAISISISYFIAAVLTIFVFAKTANFPIKKIIKIQSSDFKSLFNKFGQLFRGPGKLSREIPWLNLKKLKDYYEKKAIDGPNVIEQTFKSPKFYKRIFYSNRVDKVMQMLDIESKDKILELACGEGYYTKQIGAITPNLVATDISWNYLNKTKSYNPYKIIDYVCCSVEKIPFGDNSFDKILMSEVIEHLLDWRKGIEEVQRVLKPGGKLIITTPNRRSYLNLLCHLRARIRNRPFDEEHIKEFSRKELKELLRNYFIIENISYINYFPVFLPRALLKIVKFLKIKKFIQRIEKFFNKIPIIRGTGLIIIVRVAKSNK